MSFVTVIIYTAKVPTIRLQTHIKPARMGFLFTAHIFGAYDGQNGYKYLKKDLNIYLSYIEQYVIKLIKI